MTAVGSSRPLEDPRRQFNGARRRHIALIVTTAVALAVVAAVGLTIRSHIARGAAARDRATARAEQAASDYFHDLVTRAPHSVVNLRSDLAAPRVSAQILYVSASQQAPGALATVTFEAASTYGASYSAASRITLCYRASISYTVSNATVLEQVGCQTLPPLSGTAVLRPPP